MAETVAAVVVTYNRKEMLLGTLDTLLSQSRPLDRIILVDNASSDGTLEQLKQKAYLDNPIVEYIRLAENIGGAGGFHEGIERGCVSGYDWLWMMDDDAEPQKEALATLLNSEHAADSSTGALVTSVRNEALLLDERVLAGVMQCESIYRNRRIDRDEFNQPSTRVSSCPLLGVLVPSKVIAEVGNLNSAFFIQADDLDFTLRISAHYQIWYIRDSMLIHKCQSEQFIARSLPCVKRKRVFLAIEQQWKDYYGRRNSTYLILRRTNMVRALGVFATYLKTIGSILFFADYKSLRVGIYTLALIDGLIGRLGKRLDPTLWRKKLLQK